MPPIWFYFVIVAEFLWFFIESKWMTVRLTADASQEGAGQAGQKAAPQAAACPPTPAQALAQSQAQEQAQAPSETQTKA
jgi:hypothetical protein